MTGQRFYESELAGSRRSAPAALHNREPIAEVLADWLPSSGLVLEIASGTGEHITFFGQRFPELEWQPSDLEEGALGSINAWRTALSVPNVRHPLRLDASADDWPVERADAVLSINMVHISPWSAALGLLKGAARLLGAGAPLILYGPWLIGNLPTAASNLAFDAQLRRQNGEWGLRRVEDFTSAAERHGFALAATRAMPANNLMILIRRTREAR